MNEKQQLEKLQNRVTELESNLCYLQRDFEAQNEMILLDTKRINELETTVKRLSLLLESLSNRDSSPRTLEDEKPPHY